MRRILVLIVFLLSISTTTKAQSKVLKKKEIKGDFLIVRTFEMMRGTTTKSVLIVSDGTKELKSIPLKGVKPKNLSFNLEIIIKTLNDIKDQGYILISTNGGGANSAGVFMTNYIFQKE